MKTTEQAYKSSKKLRNSKKLNTSATVHPLHGHLKKVVVAKIPAEGGYFLKRMKLKTALQKGYYKVNATDDKSKAVIEKALEPFQNTNA